MRPKSANSTSAIDISLLELESTSTNSKNFFKQVFLLSNLILIYFFINTDDAATEKTSPKIEFLKIGSLRIKPEIMRGEPKT